VGASMIWGAEIVDAVSSDNLQQTKYKLYEYYWATTSLGLSYRS